MKKIILRYGIITSVIITILFITTTIVYSKIGFDSGEIIGFAFIILAFLVIFFAVFSYRKSMPEQLISFGKYFLIGFWITIIASVVYALVWLILYYTAYPDFMDQYSTHVISKMKSSGASDKDILAKMSDLNKLKEYYKNPFIIFGMTFLEPFPIGIVLSLIAALVARLKK